MRVGGGAILVYALGDWPAPYGIVLVADRLAAWMLLITALLAFFALLYAMPGNATQGAATSIPCSSCSCSGSTAPSSPATCSTCSSSSRSC